MGETSKSGDGNPVRGRVTEKMSSAMQVEDRDVAGYFRHQLLVVLSFREVWSRTMGVNVGAMPGLFGFDGDEIRDDVYASFVQVFNGFDQSFSYVFLWYGQSDL